MHKTVKAGLAAAVAALLLTGGAGTVAFWTETELVPGNGISSGRLGLGAADCDPGPGTAPVWTLDRGSTFDVAADDLVPGDTLTRVCTFAITADGKHLVADLTAGGGADDDSNALEGALDAETVFEVGGDTRTQISSADGGKSLVATTTVTFRYGTSSDNTSQGLSAVLADLTATAPQAHG